MAWSGVTFDVAHKKDLKQVLITRCVHSELSLLLQGMSLLGYRTIQVCVSMELYMDRVLTCGELQIRKLHLVHSIRGWEALKIGSAGSEWASPCGSSG